MLRVINKLILVIIILVILIVVWVAVNSIDQKPHINSTFQVEAPKLTEEENGYSQLKGLEVIADDSRGKNRLEGEWLYDVVHHKYWSEDLAESVVSRYKTSIESLSNVKHYPNFQLPIPNAVDGFPSYQYLVRLNQIAIINSLLHTKRGHYDDAISVLEDALVFSQRVKMDQNELLLSYMVGLAMEYDAVKNLHYLSNQSDLSVTQLVSLQKLLEAMPSYSGDRFERVFIGEYRFVKTMFDDIVDENIDKRWRRYIYDKDWMVAPMKFGWEALNIAQETLRLMVVVAPNYYIHKNRSMNKLIEHYKAFYDRANHFCEITSVESESTYEDPPPINWGDVIKPNSLGFNPSDSLPDFEEYLIRRCLAFSYVEAVKTIVALQIYEREHGEFPTSLTEIPTQYLTRLPIDPFNGGNLKYVKEKGWLISVGRDHKQSDLESGGFYFRYCYKNNECENEPIFPVNAEFLADEVE